MNFLNPLVLFGLGAAAIPILIHLFTRRRPREVPFSSLEFLSEVHQSEIRRLKLKQWLLLLLRTLAIAALALAMARPVLKGGTGAGAASSLVALVDVSGSMGAPGADGRPLTAAARRAVEDLIATMGPGDELLLVPYDRAPRPASERPMSDVGRLRAAAASLAPTAHVTDHRAALELAGKALGDARALNRELFWISDFQRAGFSRGAGTADVRLPQGPWANVRAWLVPLAPRSRANAALTDARLEPAADGAALEVRARAFGVTAADFAVEAREVVPPGAAGAVGAAARLGSGFVSLGANGEAATLLPLARAPEAGGEALLPDDALALDNRRVFASGRAGALHVLLREDGEPSPLRLALEAGGEAAGLDVQAVDATALATQAANADAIVIGDVERLGPAETQAVLDAWRGGGALLLVPGERADAAWWNGALLGETSSGTLGALDAAPAGAEWRLRLEAAGHPALEGFAARPGEPLSAARFLRTRAFAPAAGARAIARYDAARAALVEAPRVLVLSAALDAASSDFATSGAFLPLVHQCARVLARGTAAASLAPGDVWRGPAATGEWRVSAEDGRDVPVSFGGEQGATRLVTAPLEVPGLYRVWQGRALRGSFAVNPDPAESDLATVPERELIAAFPSGTAAVLRAGESLALRVREARYGRELWPWFVVIALLLLATESFVGRPTGGATRPGGRS